MKIKKIKLIEDYKDDKVINLAKVRPTLEEIETILSAMNEYEANKNNIAWQKQKGTFMKSPWGIAWNVSPRGRNPSAEQAMKLYFLALTINWQELVDQLTRTVKQTYKIAKDTAKDVAEYWDINIGHIITDINTINTKLGSKKESLQTNLQEDIEKHDTLNPKLWNEDNTLKPEVRKQIQEVADQFLSTLAEDEIKINVKDIILLGSNCSYNYTKDSDLDIHLIVETESLSCPDNLYPKLYSAYKSLFNKKIDINFYGIPVEIYVETEGVPRVSNGVYSVMEDKWIKEPVAEDIPEIDQEAFEKELKIWEDRYNKIIGE